MINPPIICIVYILVFINSVPIIRADIGSNAPSSDVILGEIYFVLSRKR